MSEWKEVDYADAAVAHRGGKHEIEMWDDFGKWMPKKSGAFSPDARFRMRHKTGFITITIPVPIQDVMLGGDHCADGPPCWLNIRLPDGEGAIKAKNAINAAIKAA